MSQCAKPWAQCTQVCFYVRARQTLALLRAQDLVAPISTLAPDNAVSTVVLELLAGDVFECIMAGLQILHSILLSPGRPSDSPAPGPWEGAAPARSHGTCDSPSSTGSPYGYQPQQQAQAQGGLFIAAPAGVPAPGAGMHVGRDPAALNATSGRAAVSGRTWACGLPHHRFAGLVLSTFAPTSASTN